MVALFIAGLIIAISELNGKVKGLEKVLTENFKVLKEETTSNRGSIAKLTVYKDVIRDLVSRTDDLERSVVSINDYLDTVEEYRDSMDKCTTELNDAHDRLVDLVMEVREDVIFCKSCLNMLYHPAAPTPKFDKEMMIVTDEHNPFGIKPDTEVRAV